jgi:Tol biopolymer transport system component
MRRALLWGILVAAAGCGPAGPALPDLVALSAEGAADISPSTSPDGSQVAFWRPGENGWDLWVADADLANARSLGVYNTLGATTPPVWSPDGQRLAVLAGMRNPVDLVTVRVSDGEVTWLVETPQFKLPIQFHPDGDRVVFAALDGESINTLAVSQSTQQVTPLLPDMTMPYVGLVSPDGKTILSWVFDRGSNTLWAANADGSNRRALTSEGFESLSIPVSSTFSPDASQVLYTSSRTGKRDIWVVSVADGSTRQLTTEIQDDYDPSWSPDGQAVAFLSTRGRQTDVWVMPAVGGEAVRVTDSPEAEAALHWGTNGTLSFVVNHSPGALWTRSLADGSETRLTPDSIDAGAFVISHDRTRLALLVDLPGQVNDLAVMPSTGGPLEVVSPASDHLNLVWSRDGTRLAYTTTQTGSQDVYTVEPGSGIPPRRLTDWTGFEIVMDWTADGTGVYVQAERESQLGDLWKVPLDSSPPERLTTIGTVAFAAISWVREPEDILIGRLESGVQTISRRSADGRLTPFTTMADGNVIGVGYSPNGETVAVTYTSGNSIQTRMLRTTDRAVVASLPPGSFALGSSVDSQRRLYQIQRGVGNVEDIGILDLATGDTIRVTATPESETQAALSADGQSVILRRVRVIQRIMRADVGGVLNARNR